MKYAALFAHLFHIRPWEWDLLTVVETQKLQAEADAWVQSNKETG